MNDADNIDGDNKDDDNSVVTNGNIVALFMIELNLNQACIWIIFHLVMI